MRTVTGFPVLRGRTGNPNVCLASAAARLSGALPTVSRAWTFARATHRG